MKRAHRRSHFRIWLVLGPLMAVIIWLAVTMRPAAPVNEVLPPVLTGEAG